MDDATLIIECVNGNPRAQRLLFDKFARKMFSVCLRYAKNEEQAEDVLQDGFVKVFVKLKDFKSEGSLEGWIRRIVANTAIDALRKAKRNPFLSDQDTDFKQEGRDELVEREELELIDLKAEVAMEAIGKLSPAYRTVFNLFVLEDCSHKEIADMLGISEGTSKSNLAKAKMNLQRMLNEKFVNIDK